MPDTPSQSLFAYGTLMTGECRYPLLVPGGIQAIAIASVPGTLYNLGSYPGLLLSGQPAIPVFGELFEFANLDRILKRLDEEEGPEYQRELIPVTLADGSTQLAWSYILAAQPAPPVHVVASGNWHTRYQNP